MERTQHFVPSSDFRFTLLHQIVLMEIEIQKERMDHVLVVFCALPLVQFVHALLAQYNFSIV